MVEYRVFETEQFQKDLKEIARSGRGDVLQKLRSVVYPQLKRHPHHGPNIRKLKNYTPQTWRYRIGAWRFFYQVSDKDKIIFLIAASHRGSAY